MSARLGDYVAAGVLSELDRSFALHLARVAEERDEAVVVLMALASRAVQNGHVCLDLKEVGEFERQAELAWNERARQKSTPKRPQPTWDRLPSVSELTDKLEKSSLCSLLTSLLSLPETPTPLALDRAGRLYLWRYASYQARLASHLLARAQEGPPPALDRQAARAALSDLFGDAPASPGADPDWQRMAAAIALHGRLCVISGGPGTGKTTTVTKVLTALQRESQARTGHSLRMLLLAPTGKAAQRLTESISTQLQGLALPAELQASLPKEASTIHRALGFRRETPTHFVHNREHPLFADVVLVDEASMVDLALMTKLVEAVPPMARLILLGDKDQLASVEAGAILGDLYNDRVNSGYSQALLDFTQDVGGLALDLKPGEGGLADHMVVLQKTYRYDADSDLGQLARATHAGTAEAALSILRPKTPPSDTTRWFPEGTTSHGFTKELSEQLVLGFSPFLKATTPEEKLEELGRFRILAAHRRGIRGAEWANRAVEQELRARGLLRGAGEWYDGRPILITQNDYQLELFNGDIGVIVDGDKGPRAHFASSQGVRSIHPARLPAHETVFAMTVHKSQGSEFHHILLLLPDEPSRVVSRELLYTAITRARQGVQICGNEQVLRHAVEHQLRRQSGLRSALWEAPMTES